jgi:hypothetical protein
MRRGTLVLGHARPDPLPAFVPVGGEGLVSLRLLARTLLTISPRAARLRRGPIRRFAGDMAVLASVSASIRTDRDLARTYTLI